MEEATTRTPLRHVRHFLSWTGRKFSRRIRKIERRLGITIQYRYAAFSIELPADHQLPVNQRYSRLYDRFLPHLAKYIEPHSTVIDVGANCGDTLAAMYEANKSLAFICVEPDDFFFDLLQKNTLRIKKSDASASISLIKSLVGKSVTDAVLVGHEGTKHAATQGSNQVDGKRLSSQTLDRLVSVLQPNSIKLL
ncbi:hypothetical protein EHM92_06820, partial [bacterium]